MTMSFVSLHSATQIIHNFVLERWSEAGQFTQLGSYERHFCGQRWLILKSKNDMPNGYNGYLFVEHQFRYVGAHVEHT